VGIRSTFYTASTFNVAIRSAVIVAVIIRGTERHTDVGEGIAVRLVHDFTTIGATTRSGGRVRGTRITSTVFTTVRSRSWAIGVLGARSADTSGDIASRLSRDLTSIKGSAISVGKTSLARSVGLTILSASIGEAIAVIITVSVTQVGVAAMSVCANGVGSHGERSIVGHARSVSGARSTSTILVTIAVGRAVGICTPGTADSSGGITNFVLIVDVTTPATASAIAISISSAAKADEVGHAVSSLGTHTIAVLGAISDAKTASLVTVGLSSGHTTILIETTGRSGGVVCNSGGQIRNKAILASTVGLTILF
jgi:hypothetical protein